MTGFGDKDGYAKGIGKVHVELRSINHKFLDIVFHLPEGFLSLEEKLKKEIETHCKRGRISCHIAVTNKESVGLIVNRPLLKKYIAALKKVRSEFGIADEVKLDTLVHLHGVLSVQDEGARRGSVWPSIKPFLSDALSRMVAMRIREGRALESFLKTRTQALQRAIKEIERRFKKVVQSRLVRLSTDEEKSSFLKTSDITEEIERLKYHVRNFQGKLVQRGPVGKELDFIAQEMQREANTMGAKSCDARISARVIQMKSEIEKIREQVQNIE
jgi:uncharacterized protein (TIGR00255 family)